MDGYDWRTKEATELPIANGEIGTICNSKNGFLNAVFSGHPWVTVGYRGWGENRDAPLELAYALTVHKAQGSEFKVVFVVVPAKCRLLSRELLYTALTRSRQRMVLLIEGDGPSSLFEYTKPEKSETVRRCTNLFIGSIREERDAAPYADHLIHRAENGLMVRSKSELVIVTKLLSMGLKFEYERALDRDEFGNPLRPDFSFATPAGDLIIWEHLGMLNRPDYRASWDWKKAWYEEHGFKLGQNLFTTEDEFASQDDVVGRLDAATVKAVAESISELIK